MFDNDSLLGEIQKKFPKTFETWDGFQTSVMANDREGLDPIIIVGLYNKPTEEAPANFHRGFKVDVANDTIDSGDEQLVEDEMRRVYPEVFAKRDADFKVEVVDVEESELSDAEEIESNSDRGMYLQQDLEALNDKENNE